MGGFIACAEYERLGVCWLARHEDARSVGQLRRCGMDVSDRRLGVLIAGARRGIGGVLW